MTGKRRQSPMVSTNHISHVCYTSIDQMSLHVNNMKNIFFYELQLLTPFTHYNLIVRKKIFHRFSK